MAGDDEATCACYAAESALYFHPNGAVSACCITSHVMGTVTGPERRSLREIWEGAAAEQLRRSLRAGSYELGCTECGYAVEAVGREASMASEFDRHAPGGHEHPLHYDFALSNRCNLACVQCNGALSSTIRATREGLPPLPASYDDLFFEQLAEMLPFARSTAFKGGEPFLQPEAARVWDLLIERNPDAHVSVATNSTVFTDKARRYVEELSMEVIISVDAMDDAVLEAVRVGVDARALWRNIDRFQQLTEAAGSTLTLTFCLMPETWQDLGAFLTEADRRGARPQVMRVVQPLASSMRSLDHAALERVLSALEQEEERLDLRGEVGRRRWRECVDWVRELAEDGNGSESSVTILSPTVLPDLAALIAELEEWCEGQPLAQVAVADDTIGPPAAGPAWAQPLRSHEWTGLPVRELPRLLAGSVGCDFSITTEVRAKNVFDSLITLETDSGARCVVRGVIVPRGSGAAVVLLALAPGSVLPTATV